MTFRPSHYEHLPNRSEEFFEPTEPYRSPSTSSDVEHLGPYRHDTSTYVQPYVSPISRAASLQDLESFEVPLHGKQESVFHQHTLLSSATHDFDASSLRPDTSFNSSQKRKEGSWADVLNDCWWWELGSVLLSCACFIAIVITLCVVQGDSLSSWHSVVSPNALISTLATISKASLLLAVAACISQLK